MTVYVGFHRSELAQGVNGDKISVLGAQIGARSTLAVSGVAANSTAADVDCIARIYTTEACCVQIGAAGSAVGLTSEVWPAEKDAERSIKAGQVVSVISIA